MTLNVAVFLGSKLGNNPKNIILVKEFSEWFASKKYNLIFGGTESGLMAQMAEIVIKNNCNVTSVFTKKLYENSKKLQYYSELIIAEDLPDRNSLMFERSDVFIALPGGIGTLCEILDVINRNLLGEINKKIFIINDTLYWNPLFKLFNHFNKNNFLDYKEIQKNIKLCKLKQLKIELNRINAKDKS